MLYKRGKGENEEVISRVETLGVCLNAWSPLAMNEFACFAYRSTLIRAAEREIKPAQNVVTNPFKCGGGL